MCGQERLYSYNIFPEVLGLRPRHDTYQRYAALESSSPEVSFAAQRYIDGLDLVADRLHSSCQMSKVGQKCFIISYR